MASDDFDVIVYKVLAYVMACAKADAYPSIDKAKEVAGCGSVYWAMVVRSMLADGLVTGVSVDSYYDGTTAVTAGAGFGITQKGANYLKENGRMREAAKFLGEAFKAALPAFVEATKALGPS